MLCLDQGIGQEKGQKWEEAHLKFLKGNDLHYVCDLLIFPPNPWFELELLTQIDFYR